MRLQLNKLDRKKLYKVARDYGVRADKLEEYYIKLTKRNFIEDISDIARENPEIFIRAEDIFTPDNTEWKTGIDDYGNISQYLVYCGSMKRLAKKYNITEDRAYEILSEYEDMSRNLIETEMEIAEARKGQY